MISEWLVQHIFDELKPEELELVEKGKLMDLVRSIRYGHGVPDLKRAADLARILIDRTSPEVDTRGRSG